VAGLNGTRLPIYLHLMTVMLPASGAVTLARPGTDRKGRSENRRSHCRKGKSVDRKEMWHGIEPSEGLFPIQQRTFRLCTRERANQLVSSLRKIQLHEVGSLPC
jgi:hypothetical protein